MKIIHNVQHLPQKAAFIYGKSLIPWKRMIWKLKLTIGIHPSEANKLHAANVESVAEFFYMQKTIMMVQPSRQEKKTSKERIRVHIDDYLVSQGSCLTGRGSKRKIYSFIHSIYTSSSATWRYSFYYREVITFRHIFTNKQWSINRTIRKNSSNTGTFLLLGFALGSTTLDFGFSFGGFSFDGISSGSSRCRFSSWCLLGGARSLGLNNSIKESLSMAYTE